MKNAVVDTSVVIKWFLDEEGNKKAQVLKEDHLKKNIRLCTLDLLLYEFTSAFKNYSRVKIEEKEFVLALSSLEQLNLSSYSLGLSELSKLFSLSRKLNLSIYDCSYILLAKKLRSSLYTSDKKLYLASKNIISSYFI